MYSMSRRSFLAAGFKSILLATALTTGLARTKIDVEKKQEAVPLNAEQIANLYHDLCLYGMSALKVGVTGGELRVTQVSMKNMYLYP